MVNCFFRVDLPGFCGALISSKMAPTRRGVHEEEQTLGRTNGRDPARGGSHESCRGSQKHNASGLTSYVWRKHFGQMEATDIKRLRTLELESSCLKKLLAEAVLDIEILKAITTKKS